jgi:hypothetical protein
MVPAQLLRLLEQQFHQVTHEANEGFGVP